MQWCGREDHTIQNKYLKNHGFYLRGASVGLLSDLGDIELPLVSDPLPSPECNPLLAGQVVPLALTRRSVFDLLCPLVIEHFPTPFQAGTDTLNTEAPDVALEQNPRDHAALPVALKAGDYVVVIVIFAALAAWLQMVTGRQQVPAHAGRERLGVPTERVHGALAVEAPTTLTLVDGGAVRVADH